MNAAEQETLLGEFALVSEENPEAWCLGERLPGLPRNILQ